MTTQQTIPLSELQCYLAYNLQVLPQWPNAKPMTLHGLSTSGIAFFAAAGELSISDFKPLVRPLSSLSDEEWLEVFKAGTDIDLIDVIQGLTIIGCRTSNGNYLRYDILFRSFKGLDSFNQLAAFNKLFELHADVYDFCGRGVGLPLDLQK